MSSLQDSEVSFSKIVTSLQWTFQDHQEEFNRQLQVGTSVLMGKDSSNFSHFLAQKTFKEICVTDLDTPSREST
ncbi:hypothetical protein, partial [Enterobacter cloacae complex sp. 4DZ1-17B1]|uniref:hypothetical protein n=1 Tax=Enterobacter cloacae complex sp. 4DZ1-17B1 TaxID=2511991 RepID=UPI001CA5581C